MNKNKTLVVTLGVRMVVVVVLFNRSAERHRGEHREHVGLERRNQEFEGGDE